MKKQIKEKQVYANQIMSNGDSDLAVIKKFVKSFITDVTKLTPNRIKDNDTFESFGMDSVQLMELQSQIADQVNGLPKTILFEQDSVEKLSKYMHENKFKELSEKLDFSTEQNSVAIDDSKILQNTRKDTTENVVSLAKNDMGQIPESGVVSIAHLFQKGASQHVNEFDETSKERDQSIAIIGMAGRFPESKNLNDFWDKLATGYNCIRPLSEERWSKYQTGKKKHLQLVKKAYGGFLNNVDGFDHEFFGLSHLDASKMDPQLSILLETVWHAIEDSVYTKESLPKNDVGVFVGAMNNDHSNISEDLLLQDNTYVGPGSVDSELSNRISFLLDVHGPSLTIKTACSSSMTALHMACKSIQTGDCKVAIVAGVNLSLHPQKYLMMQDMKVLSTKDEEKTFDANADGLIPSEGVGVVIIKQESEAINASDNIHGIIKATSISHSGVGAGQFIPNIKVLENTMQQCLDKSGLDAKFLNYVETHGTATALGDPIELRAIENFANKNGIKNLHIGTKANLGHMEAASGVCSLIKVLLSMKNQAVAPCANLNQVCDAIDLDNTPLTLNKQLIDWKKNTTGTLVAGINSFGMGGSNGFAIIESFTDKAEKAFSPTEIPVVLFSAKTKEQVELLIKDHIHYFSNETNKVSNTHSFGSVCYSTQCGRKEFSQRVAFIASSVTHLLELMNAFIESPEAENDNIVLNYQSKSSTDVIELLNRLDSQKLYQSLYESKQWHELASLWVNRMMINWKSMYQNTFPAKMSLPVYPFKHVDCAIHNVLDEIKSIEKKKNLSLSILNQNKNELKVSKNARWFVTDKSEILQKFEKQPIISGDKNREKYFSDYWTKQFAEQETILCQSLKQENTKKSKNNNKASAKITGLSLSTLKSFSSYNHIEIETIAAAAWALILNRNTKVKIPCFALGIDNGKSTVNETTDRVLPYKCRTVVKSKCLPWLVDLQAQMESRYVFSHLENTATNVIDLLNAPMNTNMDSALIINGSVSEELQRHFNIVASLIYSDEKIEVTINCANTKVVESELNRVLDEFILVLTSIQQYTDKMPGAITLKPPKNKIQTAFKRLEGM